MFRRRPKLPLYFIFICLIVTSISASDVYSPKLVEKSRDGELAIHRFKIPGGMKAELFAAEPMLANPVAFCIDERGSVYVAETFRMKHGVEDNRGHMSWLLDDLAATSVADRIAFFKKHLKDEISSYTVEHERVRLLRDTDGDGIADQSTVFADGFHAIEDGIGAGLLAINGDVFYTCIPKLWLLKDTDDDGIADSKTPMYDGFGVRVAFIGHDLHGLILGPDGRIYFSVGDRGFNVELKDKTRLVQPDRGAVFRCEIDGANLEIFCTGLRNPQELAFDDFGNLFTGDNNSDGGDKARWTYLVEGSDSGWRMYYQYMSDRGPWNREKLWHVQHAGQAAYIVPPIAHFADGPSGLAYYPGTGLDEKYRGHFFLADFRGQAANSGIRSFSVNRKGASFELVNSEEFIWSILATDVAFGFDGGIYVSDWVDGWDAIGKGRIYRFRDERHGQSSVVKEVSKLMMAGFESVSVPRLVELLSHADARIRQRAQLALVKRNAISELTNVATKGKDLFGRLHAIWGLGQLGRKTPVVLSSLLTLMTDKEPEVRTQIARVCGDAQFQEAAKGLAILVKDSDPRVQSMAAIAIGKLKYAPAFPLLLEVLAENADADPTLRHAVVMGLVGTAKPEELVAAGKMPIPAIRIGAAVALRRMAHPGLAVFLNDSDPRVVVEAASAIHDLPIAAALPALAKLLVQPGLSDPVLRRSLSANYRIGTTDSAELVAAYAGNPLADSELRREALEELNQWNSPGPLDRVTNEFRPLETRQVDIARIIRPWLGSIFASDAKLREIGTKLTAHHQIADVEPYLIEILNNPKEAPASLRVSALSALDQLKSAELSKSIELCLNDREPLVRSEARRVLAGIDPVRAVQSVETVIESESVIEQQSAISFLGTLKRDDADKVLSRWCDHLLANKVTPAIQLDLLSAAISRGTPELKGKVEQYKSHWPADDHLRDYRETLAGGDASRGREIFFGRADVSCRRCHLIDASGGNVGPDLSRIGLEKNREYLLEAIVDPSRQIAKGFETAILQLANGKVYAGIVKVDDGEQLRLQLPDGQIIAVDKSEIEERTVGKSGMPEDIVKKLTKREIRDLVEFLSTLKSTSTPAAHGKK